MYNKKHSNGRINIEVGKNYVISPYDPNFYDQVEEGVRESVKVLTDLGYLTVGSCDGCHSIKEAAHVTIVFPDEKSRIDTGYILGRLGVDHYIDHTYGTLSVEELNRLFLRNYEKYYFLTVRSYKKLPFYLMPLRGWLRKRLTRKLKKLPPYEC